MQDSGHFWMHTCDSCEGAFYCAPPSNEREAARGGLIHKWTCDTCAATAATIKALADALFDNGFVSTEDGLWHRETCPVSPCDKVCAFDRATLRRVGRLP
jgi:hypothetical protein